MAASVSERNQRGWSTSRCGEADLPGVLPSTMDCRGRPTGPETMTAKLWQRLSLDALRGALARFRRPAWEI